MSPRVHPEDHSLKLTVDHQNVVPEYETPREIFALE
jgi:hypothetical protein